MDEHLRIGELARRTGTSPELLRAWERRYKVLRPARSAGRFRLYGPGDEARVRRMKALIAEGLSAAEAARLAAEEVPESAAGPVPEPVLDELTERLEEAVDRFDEPGATEALDALFVSFTPEVVFTEVLLPFLRHLGEQWAAGRVTVGHEHFASGLVRGRLLALARGWGLGRGPLALLACPPLEQHDLSLIMFGVALHRRGWRIAYLGTDTPLESVADAAASLAPKVVVLAATKPQRFRENADAVAKLAEAVAVGIGGAGASREMAERLEARWLEGDPVRAAEALAASA
jgi:MerR family transcriptional regulator, light-induced transcriptional regulator